MRRNYIWQVIFKFSFSQTLKHLVLYLIYIYIQIYKITLAFYTKSVLDGIKCKGDFVFSRSLDRVLDLNKTLAGNWVDASI